MSIDAVAATLGQRSLPNPDHVSGHYWQSAADGRLVLQRCRSCGAYQFYPRSLCTSCAGETEWVEASGRGTLHTYTVIRQNKSPAFAALSPYVVGIVELDEGVRMMTNVVECEPDEVRIGMPLEVVLLKAADDVGLPFWRPAAG
ncbi:MAG: Zn-ribbon domain-containing OB-fold protein [Acidimicrobiales bacterium]